MDCFREFRLKVPDRTLKELRRMVLVNLVAFVVLKILHSLVSMQNFLNANNC